MSLTNQISSFVHNELKQYLSSEMGDEFELYCPFHSNTNTPSFFINKKTGLWHCWNPDCGEKGGFRWLVKKITGKNVSFADNISDEDILKKLNAIDVEEEPVFITDVYEILREKDKTPAINYLTKRGFEAATLEKFDICYAAGMNRAVIPVRDVTHEVVGFVGRAMGDETPKYLNSKGFQRKRYLFNLNNVFKSKEVIVTEGQFDAMKIFQAGYHNVVATFGAAISREQFATLSRYFDTIIAFFDNDSPGQKAFCDIIEECPTQDIYHVEYPSGVKDPGEMTEQQIKYAIENKTNYINYLIGEKTHVSI